MSEDSEARSVACVPEAQRLLRELLTRGLIGICRGGGWAPSAEVELTPDAAEAILPDPAHWHLPATAHEGSYCFYATEDGKNLWLKGRSEFPSANIQ